MSEPLRLAVLVSGGGTTLQNLLDRAADGRLAARVSLVLSNRADAFALERARRADIPTAVVTPREAGPAFSDRLFAACREARVGLVCLAGFLRLIEVPDDFRLRVLNVHPSLIPSFCGKGYYGRHVHEAVLEAGVKVSGCTVHFADNEYDRGPIIVQRPVPVCDDDTPDSLAARVFEAECEAFPEAINLFAAGRLRVEGHRVRVTTTHG